MKFNRKRFKLEINKFIKMEIINMTLRKLRICVRNGVPGAQIFLKYFKLYSRME